MTAQTNATRQSRHRAAAKAAGGGFVSTPINSEAADALAELRANGHTVRSAIEAALPLLVAAQNAAKLTRNRRSG